VVKNPELHRCQMCGKVSEIIIKKCPKCGCNQFTDITWKNFCDDDDGPTAYFINWPKYPSSSYWHPALEKD